MQNLKINAQRLWDTLMETANFGGTAKGGIKRLTLTDDDKKVRDWFKEAAEAAGCTVAIDEVGNMFARRPGRREELAPLAMGSHLDTQPTGGKFDGALGVLAALEAVRSLQEAGYETNAPIEIVNWTNEEGSRFAPAMLGSGVFARAFSLDYANERQDRDGHTFADELLRIDYRGSEMVGARKLGAMFELHIEQGPILENEGAVIGVVTGVQGMRWYEVTVYGEDAHTGATPMHLRKNALLGAARVIDAVDAIGHEFAPDAVATVGLIENKPNSRNVVPGEVFFTIDLRHPDDNVLEQMESRMKTALAAILDPLQLTYQEKKIWTSPAVHFAPELISCVRRAAKEAGLPTRDIVSGAGHDAVYVARVAPTTMIFVPCLKGISHNEAESTSFDECAAGAQVLLNALLEYDRTLA
ncbi:MAG: M20 family metallo-hydrolase [Bradyrhizobiaceae bacterium]|nr:M20 family metallo-hydrolase [Bradyrhizobiaceae bacterium]